MNVPICVSKFFVNKQSVRSYSNILGSNYFKKEDNFFYKHVVQDYVSDLSSELQSVLLELKNNLKSKSKNDFKTYFSNIENIKLLSVNKEEILKCSWKGMWEIIPRSFYGSSRNTKILQYLIKKLVYSMKNQHLKLSIFVEKWDLNVYPWKSSSRSCSQQILFNILLWIFQYILSAMISLNFYVTTCKLDSNENKLHFFLKHKWQCFYDTKISNMLSLQIIKKVDLYCLGKKLKSFRSSSENMRLRVIIKNIPKLHLILKTSNDYRPIVRYKSEQKSSKEKYKIKERLQFLKTLIGAPMNKIETEFTKLYHRWLSLSKPQLYFIKADLSNAFGSIDREKLIKIIREKHINYQKTEKCVHIKKQIAKQYKEMIAELHKPLLVRSGSTVYEWKKGLVQGYKYSPALSELYYKHLDEIYFSDHLKIDDHLKYLSRVVDDYIYITDSLDDAQLFLKALLNYKNINYKKTVVNFVSPDIKYSECITFMGYSYNTTNLEVSRTSNVYLGQMCYKISFSSAIANVSKFLENRIGQSGIQVNSHLFNLNYNNEELIWKHIFTTFCLSANKFCTTLAVVCEDHEMAKYLPLYKKRVTVKLANTMIETLLKSKPKDIAFVYCINHFRYLSWTALCLCAKNTPKCQHLVPLINDDLAKSNCIFGKWRDHSSQISLTGKCTKPAQKSICRRIDLRVIIKQFHTLPDGFEFYKFK